MTNSAEPKISIIIPAYKASETLQNAVASIRQQTFEDYEIIIIEDCSPDNGATYKKALELASADSRIKLLRTPENSGGGIARNYGIDAARGEYLLMLDADDTLAEDCLKTIYRLAKKYNADHVGFTMELHTGKGHVVNHSEGAVEQVYTDPFEIKEFTLNTFSPSYDEGRKQYPGFANSRLYRRSLLQQHKIYYPSEQHFLSEDMYFVYLSMKPVKVFVFIPNSYYKYNIAGDSTTRTSDTDMIDRAIHSTLIFEELVKNDPDAPEEGVHNAWGLVLDAIRSYSKQMFMSSRPLSYKLKWIKRNADHPLFKRIYEQYPWRRIPFKHRLSFINFYKKRALVLYLLVAGQEIVRKLRGKV